MSAPIPCWLTRREVDPRFDYGADTFDPPPGTWAPDCGHAACIEDDRRCDGFHDWDCPVALCRWDTARGICELDEGHDGPHRFVPEGDVMLCFPAAAEVAP